MKPKSLLISSYLRHLKSLAFDLWSSFCPWFLKLSRVPIEAISSLQHRWGLQYCPLLKYGCSSRSCYSEKGFLSCRKELRGSQLQFQARGMEALLTLCSQILLFNSINWPTQHCHNKLALFRDGCSLNWFQSQAHTH